MTEPLVALVPYLTPINKGLARMRLDAVEWPLGKPEHTEDATLGDLGPNDHVLIFPKRSMYLRPPKLAAKLSLMVVEPRAVHATHLRLLRLFGRRFHRVFTHDAHSLRVLPNARFLPAASTWVPDYAQLNLRKSQGTSLIASRRAKLPGHKLRHEIVSQVKDVDVIGRGYKPFEHKSEGLAPYRFSIVIESVRAPGYFSEKLIDALLCETVPIYWGAPDIDKYFDTRALILCESASDILAAVSRTNMALYHSMYASVLVAKAQAEKLRDYRVLAARALLDETANATPR